MNHARVTRASQTASQALTLRQLDLFEATGAPVCTAILQTEEDVLDPRDLGDEALLRGFPRTDMSRVEAFAQEILRRQPEGWQGAAFELWMRFFGFGQDRPCLEQRMVLRLARETVDAMLLRMILAKGAASPHLEDEILRAAFACRLRLEPARIRAGLAAPDPAIRLCALELALLSGLAPADLHPVLADPDAGLRQAAAILLAEAGDPDGRGPLIRIVRSIPSARALEALALYGDEEVLVVLGQVARRDPRWAGLVRDLLEEAQHPKAAAILASLPGIQDAEPA